MIEDMDQIAKNPQILVIYHNFLNFIWHVECPVFYALTIPSRLFTFIASSAVLVAQDLKKHLSNWDALFLVLSIVQRLYDFVMQIVETQATKPVILGSPITSTQELDFHASRDHDGNGTKNDHNLQYFVPNEDVHSSSSGPKKMVNIYENVEMWPNIKSNKKMKSMERLSSREDEIEKSKPLKFILKVGSNVKDMD
ncbi:hypothetical protein ACH5RR_001371 [Cinchona calisaya]|uniref:Uncharacterized protein n=1 Tax=Cinchona calisaya TaxID=153742 RepID=A0ABD3B382_9GENT